MRIPYSRLLYRKNMLEAYKVKIKQPSAVAARSRLAIFLVSPPSGRKFCTVGPKYIRAKAVIKSTDRKAQKLRSRYCPLAFFLIF